MEKVAKILVPLEVSKDDIEHVITTGLAGGINYWAWINWKDQDTDKNDLPTTKMLTEKLLNGGSIVFYDIEDDMLLGKMGLSSLLQGIRQYYKREGMKYEIQDFDADISDKVMQYALFGELIYG
jgi:hypothetical protein